MFKSKTKKIQLSKMQQKKLKSMRVNLTSLQTEIWDQDNLIEMKVKNLRGSIPNQSNVEGWNWKLTMIEINSG